MFRKGEYVVYGSSGVCEVVDVGAMDMSGASKGKLYYTLLPIYSDKSRVYTPIDNNKIVMRNIMSKEEALAFISEIPKVELLWISDDKKREEIYSREMKTCSPTAWTKIAKTLHNKQRNRLAEGKKLAGVDERYLKMAEDNLYGELAVSLNIERDSVEKFISDRIETEATA